MESIPQNCLLQYNPDTLRSIRKQYGLDKTTVMNEAIDILEKWLQKQTHFIKKTLPRQYLERIIIHNKGSVEKSKGKLDKLCTLRTLAPDFFENIGADRLILHESHFAHYVLPKMTADHCRVQVAKVHNAKLSADIINQLFKTFLLMSDYIQLYDYCNGVHYLSDWREGNLTDFALTVNFDDLRKTTEIAFQGYSMRIKAIHILTNSKAIDTFLTLFKQVVSKKIGDRVHVHTSLETLYPFISKDVLSADYGGSEKPLAEIKGDVLRALDSKEFKEYRKEINEARTDESYRSTYKFNDKHMGVSGTFRNLSID